MEVLFMIRLALAAVVVAFLAPDSGPCDLKTLETSTLKIDLK